MQISGRGKETFLFVNGIRVKRMIPLGSNVDLLPASCSPDPKIIMEISKSEVDLGITAIFLRRIGSQLHLTADSPKKLAILGWNSMWDIVLLSALLHCEAECNFQCSTPAEDFNASTILEITNYHLRGLSSSRLISESEAKWLEKHFTTARKMLDLQPFQNAIHALSSYRWHTLPSARLAILWSGIETLFEIESEIVFRLSLYTSRFLSPNNKANRSKVFNDVKRLYKQRSAAVHGSKIKGDSKAIVNESAQLLLMLVRRCVTTGSLPDVNQLAP